MTRFTTKLFFVLLAAFFLIAPNILFAATINSSRSQSSFQNTGINSGLIGWWTFDGKDALTDKSGREQHGTNYGADATAGRIGQAMSFNGTSDYINLGANSLYELADDVSVSAWIYVTDMDANRRGPIVSKRHGYSLYVTSGNGTSAYLGYEGFTGSSWGNNFNSSSRVLIKNRWHHIALSFKANTYDALYVDGKLVGNGVPVGGHGGYYENLLVGWGGAGEWGTPPYFAGKIDDVRIYNRAISQAEVKQLYAMGSSATINKTIGTQSYQTDGLNKNLGGWWTLDGKDISGTAIYDKSGHNYTAIRVAATPIAGKIGQALNFSNELQSYIQIPYNSDTDLTGTYSTVSEWVYADHFDAGSNNLADLYCAVGSNYSCIYSINGMTDIYFDFGAGDPYTYHVTVNASLKKWHHFVYIIDRNVNKGTVYMDGIYKGQTAAWPAYTPTVTLITIGKNTRTGNTFDFLNGKVDDVRVWTRALSPGEIKQLYAQGSSATVNKTVGTASYQQGQGINRGLVAWWTFDGKDISGTQVYDKTGNLNTGTTTGGVTKIVGKIGQGVKLDGTGAIYFGLGSSLNLPSRATLSGWVYPTVIGVSYPILFGKGYDQSGSYSIHMRTDGSIWFEIDDIDSTRHYYNPTNIYLSLNRWAHVVATYDGVMQRIYVNGVQDGTGQAASSDFGTTVAQFSIGPTLSGPGNFTGSVDDVRVWSRALSAAEIQQLYQTGK